ncbi:MAG TPA: DUF1330 domain-containing protein [Thermohalobaculum sp.]|nr:DUF1330 domain-containing protein [Thermohalobaculum sp.]
MPAAYVIAQIDVKDADAYRDYVAAVTPIIEKHGGSYLVRGGRAETVEGTAPGARTVIIRFPSFEAAKAWYESPEYSETKGLRQAASTSVQTLAEGV